MNAIAGLDWSLDMVVPGEEQAGRRRVSAWLSWTVRQISKCPGAVQPQWIHRGATRHAGATSSEGRVRCQPAAFGRAAVADRSPVAEQVTADRIVERGVGARMARRARAGVVAVGTTHAKVVALCGRVPLRVEVEPDLDRDLAAPVQGGAVLGDEFGD